ncbi:hypothetical protein Tsubulata_003766 [Turnera subulata]|uniref:Rubredoxin-like domain-containing protein n=1 Tax=Turnera subulata TaxID=218843 RepID=A0A9Q0G0U0_9ROSI|nr:hypothetical protein Tsubulata_003766 [Turnera subulata]
MACATTTRPTFSFHLLPPPKPRTHLAKLPSFISLHKPQRTHLFTLHSIDVSKEDNPVPTSSSTTQPAPSPPPPPPPEQEIDPLSPLEAEAEAAIFDKRRLEEKFAVLNTGIYECRSCGYKYDEAVGDPSYPIPPGLPYEKLPEDWRCPTCGAAKSFFESKRVEIAGFAQNQQFGLGGNTLTSGQKAILIYGSLFLFFCLFLSGYFLQ